MGRPARYHRLSAIAKRNEVLARARERPVRCPLCEVQTTIADLLPHVDQRCEGPPEPGPRSRWLTWREVLSYDVPRTLLQSWIDTKQIRYVGDGDDRRYLYRDLAFRIALLRGFHRRG